MVWLDLVRSLDRSRFAPSLVCPRYAPYDDLVAQAGAAGVPCRERVTIEGAFDFGGRARFRRLLDGFRGIVHLNQNSLDSCRHHVPALVRARDRTRLVSTVQDLDRRGGESILRRWRRRRTFRALDHVAGLSTAIAEQVRRYRGARGTSVIPAFLPDATVAASDAARARRAEQRARLGIPEGAAAGACVGLVAEHKGQPRLVERLPDALRRVPGLVLVLVGGDKDGLGPRLVARAQELSAGGALRWTGFRTDVLDVLAACDALVHPATAEGLGRVIQEAMLMALPVVAFRSGGVVDLVQDGATGALAPPGDFDALLAALADTLADPARALALGERGRARALAEFRAAPVMKAYHDLYAALAAEIGQA